MTVAVVIAVTRSSCSDPVMVSHRLFVTATVAATVTATVTVTATGHATHTATHCNTLQHTATHCNTLQHTAPVLLESHQLCMMVATSAARSIGSACLPVIHCNHTPVIVAACCSVLQCAAVFGSVSQRVTVRSIGSICLLVM